jgi:LysR family cyn operon transcriptional activator
MLDKAPQRGAALLRRKNNYHSAASSAFMDLVLEKSSVSAFL